MNNPRVTKQKFTPQKSLHPALLPASYLWYNQPPRRIDTANATINNIIYFVTKISLIIPGRYSLHPFARATKRLKPGWPMVFSICWHISLSGTLSPMVDCLL
ncbi:MAG: hypothetical protein IPH28_08690 [Cytophagaceae bacterium]|nr:hypothetical protein [Cytophagaceae bacterium]